MVFSLIIGCVHQVTWVEERSAAYPLATTQVAVVAMERACRPLADALVKELGSRPGVDVHPEATQRIFVKQCDDLLTTSVDVEGNYPGIDYGAEVYFERRRYTLHGWGRGVMEVQAPGVDPVTFAVDIERDLRGPWVASDAFDMPANPELQTRLTGDLAERLADKLAPLPETIRRVVFPDPEPGTARRLHNDAVAAERSGNLDEALTLAKAAYGADPSPMAMDYIERLEEHAEAVGYAFKSK